MTNSSTPYNRRWELRLRRHAKKLGYRLFRAGEFEDEPRYFLAIDKGRLTMSQVEQFLDYTPRPRKIQS